MGAAQLLEREAAFLRVRRDLRQFTGAKLLLHAMPEIRAEQIAVPREERFSRRPWKVKKIGKFLGKNIVRSDREPRLRRHLFVVASRLRHVAEVAIGQPAKLVVIVKNNAAASGDSKILRQKIARKNIRSRQIFDRLTPVASRGNGCLLIRFGKEKIQRPDAALDVGVRDHDVAAVDSHGAAGLPGQIVEE